MFQRGDFIEVSELLRVNGWRAASIPSSQTLCESFCWMAIDDDELAGFVRVMSDNELVTYVCEIVVAEKFRRRGVGKLLLDHIAKTFPSTRIDLLSTQNGTAFYEAIGFSARPGYRRYP